MVDVAYVCKNPGVFCQPPLYFNLLWLFFAMQSYGVASRAPMLVAALLAGGFLPPLFHEHPDSIGLSPFCRILGW